ncbi:MAG: ABC transporter ATP-binding protein [Chloroflexi bacterium]|nr:ABC transporter ATP-binding protein [Chloroflexota bacterium]
MSDIAIQVNGLSKEYHIGHVQKKNDTIGQQMADLAIAPFRRAGKLVRGQATGAAELDTSFWALNDVSFEIKRGEAVGIIGRNGAGKSTLLKILSRITEPTLGEARIYGRVGSLLEVGTGFHPELTGRENVFLNGAILGMTKVEIEQRFDEIVAFAEIEKFIDTPVKHYSSGMYVRLAFSVAAHLEPEILLVDEVLAVGDIAFQKKCLGKMDDVAHEGRTVLFVSHNMSLMQSFCPRGIFLCNGAIQEDGLMKNAVDAYLKTLEQLKTLDLSERKDRNGKGDIRLIGLDIYANGGTEATTQVISGQPIRLVFHLNQLTSDVSCLFVIFNHLGQRIAIFKSNVPSDIDKYDTDLGNSFVCDMDELLLMPGRFRVNVLIRGNGERQDFVEAAAFIDVLPGHLNGRPINSQTNFNVILPHRWIVPIK